jgi:putative transposase
LDLGVAELLPGQGGAAPFGEGVVVDHPGAPKRPSERLTLDAGRVDAVAIPDQHAAEYSWSMRQEDDDRRGRHVVAALNVHLVFVTKYRRGVLPGKHLDTLGEVFASVCADLGAELVELDGEDDHVHLLVAYPAQVAVARLVNSLKGVSARRLRQRSRVRTHREHLWSPSYFAASAGGPPLETLRAYICQQRTPDRPG